MDWLSGAGQAKADARHLRDLYGDRAEAWCEGVLAALPAKDARRRPVLRIVKALSSTPLGGPVRAEWTRAWNANPVAAADEACKRPGRRKRPNWA